MSWLNLKPLHRVLLTSGCSVTRLLEAVEGCRVEVEGVRQELVEAPEGVAQVLEIPAGSEVIQREVMLRSCRRVLMHAESYAPLGRLSREFREAVMHAEKPIGRIMEELKMEARRELLVVRGRRADAKLSEVFGIPPEELVLEREYLIISSGAPLVYITERFPYTYF